MSDFAAVLQQHLPDFRKCLDLEALIPSLEACNLVSEMERGELLSDIQASKGKCDYLVDILAQKNDKAFTSFIDCLESDKDKVSHVELAIKLRETATKLTLKELPLTETEEVQYV